MNDDMDFYLSRCMKNWAAQQKPPVDGYELLLQAVMSPPIQRERRFIRTLKILKVVFSGQPILEPRSEWLMGPYSQSRNWSFHIATNWRWAN